MDECRKRWVRTLSRVQGTLFEYSAKQGYDSEEFVKYFLNGFVGRGFYSDGHHYEWAGYRYLFDKMEEYYLYDHNFDTANVFDPEIMYWIGWVYYQWHVLTNEPPNELYKQASCSDLADLYFIYHTQDIHQVVKTIKELYAEGSSGGGDWYFS